MRHDRRMFARNRQFRLGLVVVCFCLLNAASAQTEIYKCTDADGGVMYSQLPCAPQKLVETKKTEPEAEVASPNPVSPSEESSIAETPADDAELETDTSACRKRYRDAIDAIDAEIGQEYSPEKAEHYKQRLLLLTRKLRQC